MNEDQHMNKDWKLRDTPARQLHRSQKTKETANKQKNQTKMAELAALQETLDTLSHNHAVTDNRVETFMADFTKHMATLTTKVDSIPQPGGQERQERLGFSGAHLLPPAFCGTLEESAQDFLDRLSQFCLLQAYPDARKLQLAGCLLQQRALEWFTQLSDDTKADWATFQTAILEKFGPASRDDFHVANLMQRRQQPGETVTSYTKDMRHRLKMAGLKDPERCRTYVHGLQKTLMGRVLQQHPSTPDEAERFALNAEHQQSSEKEDQLRMYLQLQQLQPGSTATSPAATPTPTVAAVSGAGASNSVLDTDPRHWRRSLFQNGHAVPCESDLHVPLGFFISSDHCTLIQTKDITVI